MPEPSRVRSSVCWVRAAAIDPRAAADATDNRSCACAPRPAVVLAEPGRASCTEGEFLAELSRGRVRTTTVVLLRGRSPCRGALCGRPRGGPGPGRVAHGGEPAEPLKERDLVRLSGQTLTHDLSPYSPTRTLTNSKDDRPAAREAQRPHGRYRSASRAPPSYCAFPLRLSLIQVSPPRFALTAGVHDRLCRRRPVQVGQEGNCYRCLLCMTPGTRV
jgi:hypothetical protein